MPPQAHEGMTLRIIGPAGLSRGLLAFQWTRGIFVPHKAGTALTISPSWLIKKSRLLKQMAAQGVQSMRGPPPALEVVPRFLGGWGRASRALTATPLLSKDKLRLPKRIVILGDLLVSWLAIQSLKNFIGNVQGPHLSR
jgi:hypothetical protein